MRPSWLTVRVEHDGRMFELLDDLKLSTVCEGAMCPNLGVCFAEKRATFLILGRRCTRRCRFCALGGELASPASVDPEEPARLAEAIVRLALRQVVITSPTRDDLPDGGARAFVRTAEAIKERSPACRVEVLVPDFQGEAAAIDAVCDGPIDLFAHNLETVERLTPKVRDRASFGRSLGVLKRAYERRKTTKSGILLGLGETLPEVIRALESLREAGCEQLALGQYLPPREGFAPVEYLPPEVFEELREKALLLGFSHVRSGPLVRSSYA